MTRMCVVVLVVVLASSGCSIVLVDGPKVQAGQVTCTRDYTFPLVDGVVGVAGIVTPFVLEAMRDRSVDKANLPLAVALWATGAVATVSAVVGASRVRRCRRVLAAPPLTAPAPDPAQPPTTVPTADPAPPPPP